MIIQSSFFDRTSICVFVLILLASTVRADTFHQKTFDSPDMAVEQLLSAIRIDDQQALRDILGEQSSKMLSSGDPVADKINRGDFVKTYEHSHHIVYEGDSRAELEIGDNQWPLPIPMIKTGNHWAFDAGTGKEEILYRHIGRNELSAIQVCLAIVDAERDYSSKDRDEAGVLEYTTRFMSSPGKEDGLYWETHAGEPPSPLGSLLAVAGQDTHKKSNGLTRHYYGYLYKILTRQGAAADGGSYDYIVKGKMIGGFAIIAYPAHYGASGIMSFIVNYDGVVYEKDLGKSTATLASSLTEFNPTSDWKKHQ
jgi:hypothetical protein